MDYEQKKKTKPVKIPGMNGRATAYYMAAKPIRAIFPTEEEKKTKFFWKNFSVSVFNSGKLLPAYNYRSEKRKLEKNH